YSSYTSKPGPVGSRKSSFSMPVARAPRFRSSTGSPLHEQRRTRSSTANTPKAPSKSTNLVRDLSAIWEGHKLAQSVAYRGLGTENPAPITAGYEKQADPVIETQLEKAGVRLAYMLTSTLQ